MNKTGNTFHPTHKFSLERVEQAYILAMEQLSRVLCQLVSKLCDDDMITNHDLENLNTLHTELRYHDKVKNVSEGNDAVSEWVEEALRSLKGKCEEFPKIKHSNHHHGQLATIAEKSSQENLLSNYLKHQSKVKHISGHHSETVNYGKEVYREDTRRSLDNPHQQKSLYSDLQRIKGKEQFLGSKQADNRKFVIKKNKMPLYNISKLI